MKDKLTIKKYIALFIGIIAMTFSGVNWQIAVFAWLAPICLLFYTRNTTNKGFIPFFMLMFIAGYVSQTSNNVFNVLALGLIDAFAFAVVFTLTYLIDKVLYKKGKPFYSTLIFPSIYVGVEFLISSLIGTSGIVAQSQFYFKPLAQLSTVTGVFGVSFMVVWFASVVNWLIENKVERANIRMGAFIYGGVFCLVLIYGLIRNSQKLGDKGTVKVATVSSHFDLHDFAINEQEAINRIIENPEMEIPVDLLLSSDEIQLQINKTIEAAKQGAKIIVWNEDALILSKTQVDSLLVTIKEVSRKYEAYILMAFLEEAKGNDPKPFNNKSVLITKNGKIGWDYLKSHPAPAEAHLINKGNSVIPYFDTEYGRIGNVICYDLDFPNFLIQASEQAIDIMLVPAYDWELYATLHSKLAQSEALQSGYALIRANGNGKNIVTNQHAHIIAEMNTFTSSGKIMYAELPIGSITTIYSIIGNAFVYVLLVFLLAIMGIRIFRRD